MIVQFARLKALMMKSGGKDMPIHFSLCNIMSLCKIISLLFFATLPLAANAQRENLQSIVDRTSITIDDTLVLTVRYTGQSLSGKPNLSQLNSHFEVLSSQQNSRRSIVNGRVTAYTDWIIALAPKKEGTLIIPSFRLGSLISDAVEIKVTPAAQAPKGQVKDIFIETDVDKTSGYVQEQIMLTYRLYFSRNISSLDKPPLDLPNILIDALPERQYNRRIGGKLYAVAEYSFALFPQESGNFVIPAQRWTLVIPQGNNRSFMGFSSRSESTRRRTDEITITVKQRPSSFPHNHTWLPADQLSLEESWSTDPSQMKPGEPITRTLTLKAKGLMSSQLPAIWAATDKGPHKAYADKPELSEEKNEAGFASTRIESTAIVMNTSGEAILPAIKFPWWDTKADKLKWITIPERSIQISASVNLPPQQQSAITSTPNMSTAENTSSAEVSESIQSLESQVTFWKMVSVILLITTLVSFLWAILRANRGNTPGPKAANKKGETQNQYYEKLMKACQSNAPEKAREYLIKWGHTFWTNENIRNLDDIKRKISDPELCSELTLLDASLYGKTANQQADLAKIARLLKTVGKNENNHHNTSQLKPLYAS